MRIPILTYQPAYIHGNTYETNHLVALGRDLRGITDAGFRIRPLASLVEAWREGGAAELEGDIVAITCDDSFDLATRDLVHPVHGPQRSVLSILREFQAERPGQQPGLHVTTFEIVSPEARAALDRHCLVGQRWWGEEAWHEAVASGLMHVASHSWDHNHEALPDALAAARPRGSFEAIRNEQLADHEVKQASDYLRARVPNPGCALFAYPYGAAPGYLVHEYLPQAGGRCGLRAAFSGRRGFWRESANPWDVPRFVCTRDWNAPRGLESVLNASRLQGNWRDLPDADLAGDSAALNAFASFLHERVEPIEGWLVHEAALFTGYLHGVQRDLGIRGPALEIGVYRGKYLAVLFALSKLDERVVGVDLFAGMPEDDEGAKLARTMIEAACGETSRLQLIVADSMDLDAAKVAERTGLARFRFVSVDAGHTAELVLKDLRTAAPLLQEGGIAALDDAFNCGTPGVIEGIARFFIGDRPPLAPFAICHNKLFVTTPSHHARYLEAARRFLDQADWLGTSTRTIARNRENAACGFTTALFGYEVLCFV